MGHNMKKENAWAQGVHINLKCDRYGSPTVTSLQNVQAAALYFLGADSDLSGGVAISSRGAEIP